MINDVKGIYLAFFIFILSLFLFLVSGNTIYLFISLVNLFVIPFSIINIKKYNPKLYYLVFIPFLVLQGVNIGLHLPIQIKNSRST